MSNLLSMQPVALEQDIGLVEACRALSDVYPKSRNPEAGNPTLDEARAAVDHARTVRNIISARLH